MKKIILYGLMMMFCLSLVSAASHYFSSSTGSDANDGTIGTPYASITKANSVCSGGDTCYFMGGDIFRPSVENVRLLLGAGLNDANPTIATSYGTGKAIFLGSQNLSSTANWTNVTATIWVSPTLSYALDIGEFSNYNTSVYGVKRQYRINLSTQGDFTFNTTSQKMEIYSVGNPATYYGSIEAWIMMSEGKISSFSSYTIIENLSMKFSAVHGIAGSASHNIIRNLDISFVGGAYQSPPSISRYGNCIEMAEDSVNVQVINNVVHDCFDAGITMQDWDTNGHNFDNNYIAYNIMYNNRFNWEYTHTADNATSSSSTNNTFVHNTLFNSTGWRYGNNLWSVYSAELQLWAEQTSSNWTFRDNIFYNPNKTTIKLEGTGAHYNWVGPYPNFDYNLYYNTTIINLVIWEANNYVNLSAFQTGQGQEAYGLQADPLLNMTTFKPAYNSPACNMSSTGSYVGALPCADAPVVEVDCSRSYGMTLTSLGGYLGGVLCTVYNLSTTSHKCTTGGCV